VISGSLGRLNDIKETCPRSSAILRRSRPGPSGFRPRNPVPDQGTGRECLADSVSHTMLDHQGCRVIYLIGLAQRIGFS
jgi:hypothetical protein